MRGVVEVGSQRFTEGREPAWREGSEAVVEEEPLEIRVEGAPTAVTMRTPGPPEEDWELVTGFLLTEGVIDGADDLAALAHIHPNRVDVRLASGVPPARARSADRALFATSSCGVCGKASIERLARAYAPLPPPRPLSPEALLALLPALEAGQARFAATGGCHAAALLEEDSAGGGRVWAVREDVGRHNAVDKCVGAWVRAREDAPRALVVSSRAGFEVVQKAWAAGVGQVIAVGAPSSLAVSLAREAGMVLVAWARPGRFTRFA